MALKIGVIPWPPGVMPCFLDRNCDNPGYGIETTRLVCEYLRLNCTFLLYNGTDFGDYNETSGQVTGILGAVYKGQFDTSTPIFTPTYRRFQAVGFSDVYFYTSLLMATRSRALGHEEADLNIVNSFQWPIWIALLFSFLLISLIISLRIKTFDIKSSPLLSVFFKTFMSLLSNCHEAEYWEYKSLRAMLVCWLYASVVLMASCTGFLFSYRIPTLSKPPFNDLESFVTCLQDGRCKLITSPSSASFMQLLTATQSLSSTVTKVLERYPTETASDQEIPARILAEKNVYLVWPGPSVSFFYHAASYADCTFFTVEAPYKVFGSFPLRKGSPITHSLNNVAALFHESGMAKGVQIKYGRMDSSACDGGQQRERFSPATLRGLASLFKFYLLCMLSGTALLFLEIMTHWESKRRQYTTSKMRPVRQSRRARIPPPLRRPTQGTRLTLVSQTAQEAPVLIDSSI